MEVFLSTFHNLFCPFPGLALEPQSICCSSSKLNAGVKVRPHQCHADIIFGCLRGRQLSGRVTASLDIISGE